MVDTDTEQYTVEIGDGVGWVPLWTLMGYNQAVDSHIGGIYSMVTKDNTVVTAARDDTIRCWKADDGEHLWKIEAASSSLCLVMGETRLFAGAWDGGTWVRPTSVSPFPSLPSWFPPSHTFLR